MRKLLLAFLFAGVGVFAYSVASAANLSVSPTSNNVTSGNEFTVSVILNTQNQGVDAVDVYSLNFNPALLEVVDSNSGVSGVQIAPTGLFPVTIVNSVNNTTGKIQFSQGYSAGSSYNGTGTLANVTFRGKANGTSNLTFDYTAGSAYDSNVGSAGVDVLSSVTNGTATVTGGSSTPPPPPPPLPPPAPMPPPAPNPVPPPPPAPTPTPTPVPPPGFPVDGTLVKDSGSPAIYIVEYGKKRPFATFAAFTGYGFKTSMVVIMNTAGIPMGDGIFTSNARHTRGTLVVINGTVYFLGAQLKYGFPSAAVFYSWGRSFAEVVPGNSYDMSIPEGPIVTMKQ